MVNRETTIYGGTVTSDLFLDLLPYVASGSIPLKNLGLFGCGWESDYRYNIQQVKPDLSSHHKQTDNIILRAGGHPTGFSRTGGFHPDSVNEHA